MRAEIALFVVADGKGFYLCTKHTQLNLMCLPLQIHLLFVLAASLVRCVFKLDDDDGFVGHLKNICLETYIIDKRKKGFIFVFVKYLMRHSKDVVCLYRRVGSMSNM